MVKDRWPSKGFEDSELSNQELKELYKRLELIEDIENRSLEWLSRTIQTDQRRVAATIFEGKPEGR